MVDSGNLMNRLPLKGSALRSIFGIVIARLESIDHFLSLPVHASFVTLSTLQITIISILINTSTTQQQMRRPWQRVSNQGLSPLNQQDRWEHKNRIACCSLRCHHDG
jgi:hypothetical protein